MTDLLSREFIYLAYYCEIQLKQILPYYFLGMVAGSFISVFAKNSLNRLVERMGVRRHGFLGLIIAIILGFASPLCMYGTIPLAAALYRQGIKQGFLAAFMMASILINPQLLIYSLVLGETAFWVRLISAFFCALAAGLLVEYATRGREFFNFDGFADPHNHDTDPNLLLRFLKNLGRNFKATFIYVVIGILLAALFTRVVPADLFTSLFGRDNQLGVFAAATIGVPVYVCGGGTIPLLQEWLWSGMSMGACAAFMLTGPATKITNLGAVKIILGARAFSLYIAFIMLFACLAGLITNLIV